MSIFINVSRQELARIAQLCYEGKYARFSLAYLQNEGYDAQSSRTDWDSIKLSGNGYADFRGKIEAGAYDFGDNRYEMPALTATFTAEGGLLTYNKIYIVLASASTFNITYAQLASNVVTITTDGNHGFTTGQIVVVSGATNSVFNGNYLIASAPTLTTFTYAKTAANVAYASSSGTASRLTEETQIYGVMTEAPQITLASGQTINYRIQFSTDD